MAWYLPSARAIQFLVIDRPQSPLAMSVETIIEAEATKQYAASVHMAFTVLLVDQNC